MREMLHKMYGSITDSAYFWIIVFILGIVAYTYVTTPDERPKESPEFYSCINTARDKYIAFWADYEKNKPEVHVIRDVDNIYQAEKEYCYMKYHSYFRLFGETMTNYEIIDKVREFDTYITPETQRKFDSSPIEVQIEFYKQLLPISD